MAEDRLLHLSGTKRTNAIHFDLCERKRIRYRHFLIRGFNKVRGEWGLMALAYNFTRVFNILDFDGFVRHLTDRTATSALLRLHRAGTAALARAAGLSARFSIAIAQNARIYDLEPARAA
jgi:hypothetical protein